jgi:hypothetical protein
VRANIIAIMELEVIRFVASSPLGFLRGLSFSFLRVLCVKSFEVLIESRN